MTRLSRAADRLSTGSRLYARRLGARAAAWCARGRRDDLTGWRAALGIIVRLALLALGVYLLARLVRALPSLMWLLTSWWTVAAWRAGKPAAEAAEQEPEEAPAAPDVEVVRTLLLDLMGTGSGVHLRTVLAHLQEHGQWEGRTVTDLRAHLGRLGVPHDARVKLGGVPTWGVRRRDLDAPSPAAAQETSPTASTAA
ncbi:hypothetical protein [Streptomyces scabiei]|uniref:hypothetical protein n=1 Tax=Streptomyces scabiei TaxID=1930 RepID=UPI001B3079FE|nr:hypothetical protein [Streptomyces sp. LBUM 1475]QTU64239.1 hypothetical protein F3K22_27375 [Streptomyces sp. LBUM 1475]